MMMRRVKIVFFTYGKGHHAYYNVMVCPLYKISREVRANQFKQTSHVSRQNMKKENNKNDKDE